MHETYANLNIDGVPTDVTVTWTQEEVDDYHYIEETHVWRTVTEHRIVSVHSADEYYDFDYAPLTPFEVVVSAAYQQNCFHP